MLNRICGVLTILLFSAVSASAVPSGNDPVPSKTLVLNQWCIQAEIWGDVEIVLSPAYADRIVLQGDANDINRIATGIKNGRLTVKARRVKQQTTKTRIIVPAAMLSFIRVNGKGLITSSGQLNTPQLKVELNGEASVQLRSSGSVQVQAGPDYDLSTH